MYWMHKEILHNNEHATSPCPPNLQMVIKRWSHGPAVFQSDSGDVLDFQTTLTISTWWCVRVDVHHISPHQCPSADTFRITIRTERCPKTMQQCDPWLNVVEMFHIKQNNSWLELLDQLTTPDSRTAHQKHTDLAQFLQLGSTTDICICTVNLQLHMKMTHVLLRTVHPHTYLHIDSSLIYNQWHHGMVQLMPVHRYIHVELVLIHIYSTASCCIVRPCSTWV